MSGTSLQQTADELRSNLSNFSSASESFKSQASECESIYHSKDEFKKMLYTQKQYPTLSDNQIKGIENLKIFKENISKVSEIFLKLWELQDASITKQFARLDGITQVLIFI